MQPIGGGAGALPVTVMVQNGPCSGCKFWLPTNRCKLNKKYDENFECGFFVLGEFDET
jgi:hypothetical protein